MKFYKICSITKRSDECPTLMIINEVFLMFKKKPHNTRYDKTNKQFLNVAFVPENRWLGLKIYIPDTLTRLC